MLLVIFVCVQPGYTGNNCESMADPCDAEPCLNGADCVKIPDSDRFHCTCKEGKNKLFEI